MSEGLWWRAQGSAASKEQERQLGATQWSWDFILKMLGTHLRMLNSRSWSHHRIYIFEKPSDNNVEDGLTEKGLVGDRETYMDILMIKGEKTRV